MSPCPGDPTGTCFSSCLINGHWDHVTWKPSLGNKNLQGILEYVSRLIESQPPYQAELVSSIPQIICLGKKKDVEWEDRSRWSLNLVSALGKKYLFLYHRLVGS